MENCRHLQSTKRGHALVTKIGRMGRTTMRSFIAVGINIPYADWNGHAEIVIQIVYPTRHLYVLLLNMGLHAGIHAQKEI
jgi:hypothetical protein